MDFWWEKNYSNFLKAICDSYSLRASWKAHTHTSNGSRRDKPQVWVTSFFCCWIIMNDDSGEMGLYPLKCVLHIL